MIVNLSLYRGIVYSFVPSAGVPRLLYCGFGIKS